MKLFGPSKATLRAIVALQAERVRRQDETIGLLRELMQLQLEIVSTQQSAINCKMDAVFHKVNLL